MRASERSTDLSVLATMFGTALIRRRDAAIRASRSDRATMESLIEGLSEKVASNPDTRPTAPLDSAVFNGADELNRPVQRGIGLIAQLRCLIPERAVTGPSLTRLPSQCMVVECSPRTPAPCRVGRKPTARQQPLDRTSRNQPVHRDLCG